MPCPVRMKTIYLRGLLWLYLLGFGYLVLSVEPGYLDFDNLPDTNFSCVGKVIGGYYADLETNCQMFHVCTIGQLDEPMDIRFLCLNGTVFDQETRVCERIDEVDCSKSEQFYSLNLELYGNTQPSVSDDNSETDPPIIIKPTTTTTTTTTTPRPKPKTTRAPYYTTATPTITTVTKVISTHHFPISSQTDIRFNPEEINISLNPSSAPNIRTKSVTYQQQVFTDNNNNNKKTIVTTHTSYGNEDKEDFIKIVPQTQRPQVTSTTQKSKNVVNYGLTHDKTQPPATPADINYGFTYHQTENGNQQYYTESPQHNYQYHTSNYRQGQFRNQFKTTTYRTEHVPTTRKHPYHKEPTTYRNPYVVSSVKPANYQNTYRTDNPQRLQLPVPLLPTLPPLTFSSPAPFSLTRHIEAKRYTNDHQPPPRIIISASASVSDASGRRLNYSLGTIGVTPLLEEPPKSYDEYKDQDVVLDPFYQDVPKIKSKKRRKRQIKHSDIIRNEQEAADVLKFLFDWYKEQETSTTVTVPIPPEVITEINEQLAPIVEAPATDTVSQDKTEEIEQTPANEGGGEYNFRESGLFQKKSKFNIVGDVLSVTEKQEEPTTTPTSTPIVNLDNEDYVDDNYEALIHQRNITEDEEGVEDYRKAATINAQKNNDGDKEAEEINDYDIENLDQNENEKDENTEEQVESRNGKYFEKDGDKDEVGKVEDQVYKKQRAENADVEKIVEQVDDKEDINRAYEKEIEDKVKVAKTEEQLDETENVDARKELEKGYEKEIEENDNIEKVVEQVNEKVGEEHVDIKKDFEKEIEGKEGEENNGMIKSFDKENEETPNIETIVEPINEKEDEENVNVDKETEKRYETETEENVAKGNFSDKGYEEENANLSKVEEQVQTNNEENVNVDKMVDEAHEKENVNQHKSEERTYENEDETTTTEIPLNEDGSIESVIEDQELAEINDETLMTTSSTTTTTTTTTSTTTTTTTTTTPSPKTRRRGRTRFQQQQNTNKERGNENVKKYSSSFVNDPSKIYHRPKTRRRGRGRTTTESQKVETVSEEPTKPSTEETETKKVDNERSTVPVEISVDVQPETTTPYIRNAIDKVAEEKIDIIEEDRIYLDKTDNIETVSATETQQTTTIKETTIVTEVPKTGKTTETKRVRSRGRGRGRSRFNNIRYETDRKEHKTSIPVTEESKLVEISSELPKIETEEAAIAQKEHEIENEKEKNKSFIQEKSDQDVDISEKIEYTTASTLSIPETTTDTISTVVETFKTENIETTTSIDRKGLSYSYERESYSTNVEAAVDRNLNKITQPTLNPLDAEEITTASTRETAVENSRSKLLDEVIPTSTTSYIFDREETNPVEERAFTVSDTTESSKSFNKKPVTLSESELKHLTTFGFTVPVSNAITTERSSFIDVKKIEHTTAAYHVRSTSQTNEESSVTDFTNSEIYYPTTRESLINKESETSTKSNDVINLTPIEITTEETRPTVRSRGNNRRVRPSRQKASANQKKPNSRHRFSTELNVSKPRRRKPVIEEEIINVLTLTTESIDRREDIRSTTPAISTTTLTDFTEDVPATDAPLFRSANPTQAESARESLHTTPLSRVYKFHVRKEKAKSFIFNCFGKPINKFYSDPRDCRLFHYCTTGYTKNQLLDMKFVCDLGTYFDDEKLICTKVKPERCL